MDLVNVNYDYVKITELAHDKDTCQVVKPC
jgi:hypothetical protein